MISTFLDPAGYQLHLYSLPPLIVGAGIFLLGLATLVRERRIMSIPDLREGEHATRRTGLLAREEFVSYYTVPLIAKEEVKAALEIFHRQPLSPEAQRPDVKMIVITGYPLADEGQGLLERGITSWLPKPFSEEQILARVRAALDAE